MVDSCYSCLLLQLLVSMVRSCSGWWLLWLVFVILVGFVGFPCFPGFCRFHCGLVIFRGFAEAVS